MISHRERFDILPSRFSFRSKSNYQTQPANQITKKLNQISVVNTNLTVNDREHFATFTTHLPLIYHIFEQLNFIINSHYPTENITYINFFCRPTIHNLGNVFEQSFRAYYTIQFLSNETRSYMWKQLFNIWVFRFLQSKWSRIKNYL